MGVAIDHIFICTSRGAPAADRLHALGLTEGSPNVHPGQGTACRRFFLENAMLELLWVADEAEAKANPDLRLWDRWSRQQASPFGLILRPDSEEPANCPFEAWEYRPITMPELSLKIALETALDEPMWCYMASGRKPTDAAPERRQPLDHSLGVRELTGVEIGTAALPAGSVTACMARAGLIVWCEAAEPILTLEFDGVKRRQSADLRPHLPLAIRW
ncbi:MAG: VOC family protein [Bryobacteraceae bacterium]